MNAEERARAKEQFSARLRLARELRGLTIEGMARELSARFGAFVSSGKVGLWLRGQSLPHAKSMEMLEAWMSTRRGRNDASL